jgi:ABC-type hemin transport system substrate-binding protein
VNEPRFVSLVPSSTETLLALGADVVACTRFCEQPGLPTVGGTKNPDVAAIVALAPDVVVLDREENRREDHDALVAAGLRVFVSDVRSVNDARRFVDDLRVLLGAAVDAAAPSTDDPPVTRSAFVPIWRRPWMSISERTYGASVLRRLGIDVVTTGAAVDYPIVELDAIAEHAPDLVLVPSEPYDFTEVHLDEMRAALASSRVMRVDGRDLFWWGARTPGALLRLGVIVG